jgi:hypothetical protein
VGYWKNKLIEEQDRGYSAPDETFVCPNCVSDSHLVSALKAAIQRKTCSYCGAEWAADMKVLLDEIKAALLVNYDDPAEELPYDSAEGGYQGEVCEGFDLVYDLDGWTERDELLEDAANAFSWTDWCKRDYFGTGEYDILRYGWRGFCKQVMTQTRFLFLEELTPEQYDPDAILPGQMLGALGKLFREFSLFLQIPAGGEFVRSRLLRPGERPTRPAELGTVPRHLANRPNRMSPAGIPMFYAAFDDATAVLETYESAGDERTDIVLAQFKTARPLTLLDLVHLPAIPSDFDPRMRERYPAIRFLRHFEEDFTRPVLRDDTAHTEYVPTQIVTEFVRRRLRTSANTAVDGIVYRSSRNRESKVVVIFADPEQCGPQDGPQALGVDPFLMLGEVRYATVAEFADALRAG